MSGLASLRERLLTVEPKVSQILAVRSQRPNFPFPLDPSQFLVVVVDYVIKKSLLWFIILIFLRLLFLCPNASMSLQVRSQHILVVTFVLDSLVVVVQNAEVV